MTQTTLTVVPMQVRRYGGLVTQIEGSPTKPHIRMDVSITVPALQRTEAFRMTAVVFPDPGCVALIFPIEPLLPSDHIFDPDIEAMIVARILLIAKGYDMAEDLVRHEPDLIAVIRCYQSLLLRHEDPEPRFGLRAKKAAH
jgi:hypothetical protein